MRGIISKMLKASIKKGTTLKVLQRYLRMKYRIHANETVLAKRKKQIK
tara:strand:- start:129 stop:272 length:144 start_codon:yes stop_codon:yes gene_type:complete